MSLRRPQPDRPLGYVHLYGTQPGRGGQGGLFVYDAPSGVGVEPTLLFATSASRRAAWALLGIFRRLALATGVPVTAGGPLFETER